MTILQRPVPRRRRARAFMQLRHRAPKIPGRTSMLFDPGSRINIVRATTAKEIADSASGFGDMKCRGRDNALLVNGVGAGSAPCALVGSFPIACSYKGGTRNDSFTADVASGRSVDHLPAILGLDSLQDKIQLRSSGAEARRSSCRVQTGAQ